MAASQQMRLLFDSDASGGANNPSRRTFSVTRNEVALITAAGLGASEKVQIYVRAGASNQSRTSGVDNLTAVDYLWSPLFRCGRPVELSATNNQHAESVPGTYSVGDPANAPTFAGDVNISHETLGAEFRSMPGECPVDDNGGGPNAVIVQSSCTSPVFVELCETPTFMVETALAQLGGVYDSTGTLTGRVMVVRTVDEDNGVVTTHRVLYNTDGTTVDPYTGPWSDPEKVVARPKKILTHTNLGVLSMADIIALSGATIVHSVSVTQVVNIGLVASDAGNGIALQETEVHHFSATTIGEDSLSNSILSMTAGVGGQQHVTAIYTQ